MKTRFQAFALAGVLTLTVLTGGFAITGMKHGPAAPVAATPVAAQVVPAAPAPAPPHEEGDA